MDRRDVMEGIQELFRACPGNTVDGGLTLFAPPLAGIAPAEDPLFDQYRRVEVIGPWFMGPSEWLPEARSVVSIFFPFSERVRSSNRGDPAETSTEWLWGRVEGQAFIAAFTEALCRWFGERGAGCCAPCIDGRFRAFREGNGLEGWSEATERTFGSNWSERHAAYACGLGTFGLSRGIITERGMAGRFTSVIVDAGLEPDGRPYSGLYDNCIRCGACIRRCPARAISLEGGKDHIPCAQWQDGTRVRYAPRYGCGKCQTGVPCEARNPAVRARPSVVK